jgi:hypothetical protein
MQGIEVEAGDYSHDYADDPLLTFGILHRKRRAALGNGSVTFRGELVGIHCQRFPESPGKENRDGAVKAALIKKLKK